MCICCIICDASERFPFVMCSVRDEMYTRPTSDVKVHPISGTTCCLDESLPEDKRGTWLAINHKLGTFSLLTNSSQQGRPEPPKGKAPSRGLLVLSAAETKTGRLSEENLAVPVSWTNMSKFNNNENDATQTLRKNIFNSPENIAHLSGFNLLSGTLIPGNIDVRFSSNLYEKQFDECLYKNNNSGDDEKKTSNSNNNSWSMSNTFLDNKHEPRLNWLKEHARETLKKFMANDDENNSKDDGNKKHDEKTRNMKRVNDLANELGKCMIAQPNFSNEDLPIEHLNLSEKDKQNPLEVELERVAQRNISSYMEWLDDDVSPATEDEQEQQVMFETHHSDRGGTIVEDNNTATPSTTALDDGNDEETPSMHERHNSRKIKSMGVKTPYCTSQTKNHHCRFDWGTRTHIIVITEKIFSQDDPRLKDNHLGGAEGGKKVDCLVHFLIRSVHARVNENGPRHGPAQQPSFELVPDETWKHLALPHFV